MAIVKYKAYATYTECLFFTKEVDVDDSIYTTYEDQYDYVYKFLLDDLSENYLNYWVSDGSATIDDPCIDDIRKI